MEKTLEDVRQELRVARDALGVKTTDAAITAAKAALREAKFHADGLEGEDSARANVLLADFAANIADAKVAQAEDGGDEDAIERAKADVAKADAAVAKADAAVAKADAAVAKAVEDRDSVAIAEAKMLLAKAEMNVADAKRKAGDTTDDAYQAAVQAYQAAVQAYQAAVRVWEEKEKAAAQAPAGDNKVGVSYVNKQIEELKRYRNLGSTTPAEFYEGLIKDDKIAEVDVELLDGKVSAANWMLSLEKEYCGKFLLAQELELQNEDEVQDHANQYCIAEGFCMETLYIGGTKSKKPQFALKDTHTNRNVLGGRKPDVIAVPTDRRQDPPSAMDIIFLFELTNTDFSPGKLGEMLTFVQRVFEKQPFRTAMYSILTNLQTATFVRSLRDGPHYVYNQLSLHSPRGGTMLNSIFAASPSELGYNLPQFVIESKPLKILKVLGVGAFANVYAAEVEGKEYAVKHTPGRDEVLHEGDVLRKLNNHCGEVDVVFPTVKHTDHKYLVMEPVGQEVYTRITGSLVSSLIDGIKVFHDKVDHIHFDLRPNNLLMHDSKLYLIDFGCAVKKGTVVERNTYAGCFRHASDSVCEMMVKGTSIRATVSHDLCSVVRTIYSLVSSTNQVSDMPCATSHPEFKEFEPVKEFWSRRFGDDDCSWAQAEDAAKKGDYNGVKDALSKCLPT